MNIIDAAVMMGSFDVRGFTKISRQAWGDARYFLDPLISLPIDKKIKDETGRNAEFSREDLLADDWEIIE